MLIELNSKSEYRNKFEIQMFKFSKPIVLDFVLRISMEKSMFANVSCAVVLLLKNK